MRKFSPTDAALEGFRFVREKPRVVMVWALLYLVVSAVTAVLMVNFAGDALMALRAAEEAGEAAAPSADALAKLAPLTLFGLVISTVFAAAVYRAILRPADDRWAYLRFGADELRLMLLAVIFVGLIALVTFLVVLVFGILAAIVAGIASMGGGDAGVALVGILGGLASLALLPAFVWLWIRMSLAWPMTFAERRIRVFQSWTLSKGSFWRLFAAYVLGLIFALIVVILGMIIYAAVAGILTGELTAVGQVMSPDLSSPEAYFTPAMLIYILFAGVLGPLQYLLMFAPGAVAYRELTDTPEA